MMSKETIGLLYVMKIIKLALTYASILIATNYTSQIYTEKVYVKQENPPRLINMLYLFLGIEILMTVIVMTLMILLINFIVSNPNAGQSIEFNIVDVVTLFGQDYFMYLITMSIIGSIIATTMYNKKYFLYKEDGMRGIRAYKEMITQLSLTLGVIPFNLFISGAIAELGAKNPTFTI